MTGENQNYEQGYRSELTKKEKVTFRQRFCQKSTWKGLGLTFMTLASIYAVIWTCFQIIQQTDSLMLSGLVALFSVIFATRQMRALENIVHFGSHNNFTRRQDMNDVMTNLLAAWPMLQEVKQYRLFHATHHGDYGSHDDPCKERLERIGATGIEIDNNRQLILAILLRMPSYVREYYNEVKSSHKQVVTFLAWHAFIILGVGVFVSWALAAFVAFNWIVGMFFILPFLRSVAEFSEHDYQRGKTVCDTTFNNLGLLDHILLHPAGDAWHALHHLHPTIPWWKQGSAHRYLMKYDAAYLRALHRDQLIQDIANLPGAKTGELTVPERDTVSAR